MSIDVWIKSGRKVMVGGKELVMMPLPLTKLYPAIKWLETNAVDVINEHVATAETGKTPSPLGLISEVLMRVDISQLAYEMFSYPKDPETRQPLNQGIDKQFFEDYLDIPTAHKLYLNFIEINEVGDLLKNMQSLPVLKKLMDASSIAFGIPFLNSLQRNTDSTQTKSEGSPSPKSTDTPTRDTIAEQALGTNQEINTKNPGMVM